MKTNRVKIEKISAKELMDKLCSKEILENETLFKIYEDGFIKAWKYKEIERKGWEISSKYWRKKYEDGQ